MRKQLSRTQAAQFLRIWRKIDKVERMKMSMGTMCYTFTGSRFESQLHVYRDRRVMLFTQGDMT